MVITDYDRFLSKRSKARKPSAIRALQPLIALPGMVKYSIYILKYYFLILI